MRRNRKNSIKKERIIMIASSAFVLTALTLTGIYMKEGNVESQDDGYTIDFTALEEDSKSDGRIAQNDPAQTPQSTQALQDAEAQADSVLENDLDYMPMEAGSNLVEIPGLTDDSSVTEGDGQKESAEGDGNQEAAQESSGDAQQENAADEQREEAAGVSVVIEKELSFSEGNGLTRPVSGEVLLPYSMDGSVYFATLDQYKYNPAVIFSAEQGTQVLACAEGKVISIFQNEEIGHAVTLDLGSGYQATYGQLEGIQVTLESYVNPGDVIATVAAPTKYFSAEGSNLYFELTKDGVPVNPDSLF